MRWLNSITNAASRELGQNSGDIEEKRETPMLSHGGTRGPATTEQLNTTTIRTQINPGRKSAMGNNIIDKGPKKMYFSI